MFERGVVTDRKKRRIGVVLTMDDGSVVRGNVIGAHSSLGEILSNGSTFLELAETDGKPVFLAMSSIRKIEFSSLPKADQLSRQENMAESSNPYQILGVSPDVDESELARAYHRLTRLYHPDRMASLELPAEITEYASAMQKRFNTAFAELSETLKRRRFAPEPAATTVVFERTPAWARKAS